MIRVQPRWCAALAATLALAGAAAARAQTPQAPPAPQTETHFFAADATEAGVISLSFFGADGAPVAFFERVEGQVQQLGTTRAAPGAPTTLQAAATWRCDRLVRKFEAISVLPNGNRAIGAYSVRTPSCATRFEFAIPRRLTLKAVGRIRVIDRWNNGGVTAQLCITPPKGERDCSKLRLPRAVAVATRRFRPTALGRWRVELRFREHRLRRSIAVGEADSSTQPPPTVLATGDSTLQGIDSFLADELGDSATVESDIRPGTGISKPRGPWKDLPRAQVKRLRQATTVISIGAADKFPMDGADGAVQPCCDEEWIVEYSRRVRAMMQSYRREGRGRVIWLTLPIPKGDRDSTDAINEAVARAGDGLDRVTVLHLDLLFSPDGYQEVIRYRGSDVRVREPDGIHLNIAGTAIAAKLVAKAIREE